MTNTFMFTVMLRADPTTGQEFGEYSLHPSLNEFLAGLSSPDAHPACGAAPELQQMKGETAACDSPRRPKSTLNISRDSMPRDLVLGGYSRFVGVNSQLPVGAFPCTHCLVSSRCLQIQLLVWGRLQATSPPP